MPFCNTQKHPFTGVLKKAVLFSKRSTEKHLGQSPLLNNVADLKKSPHHWLLHVVRCAIWHYLYNLKNVKNTHGCFSCFLNCTNATKSNDAPHIFMVFLDTSEKKCGKKYPKLYFSNKATKLNLNKASSLQTLA